MVCLNSFNLSNLSKKNLAFEKCLQKKKRRYASSRVPQAHTHECLGASIGRPVNIRPVFTRDHSQMMYTHCKQQRHILRLVL